MFVFDIKKIYIFSFWNYNYDQTLYFPVDTGTSKKDVLLSLYWSTYINFKSYEILRERKCIKFLTTFLLGDTNVMRKEIYIEKDTIVYHKISVTVNVIVNVTERSFV